MGSSAEVAEQKASDPTAISSDRNSFFNEITPDSECNTGHLTVHKVTFTGHYGQTAKNEEE